MTGHVFKRRAAKGNRWLVVVDHGYQPSRRCPSCRQTVWTAQRGDLACDQCGTPLDEPAIRRRRVGHGSFTRETDAKRHLADVLGRALQGTYVQPKRRTLADYIENEWLPSLTDVRLSTLASYARNLRTHVLPRIGGVQLQEIEPAMLERLYADLLESGRRGHRAGEGLSPRTTRYIAAIVHKALSDAAGKNYVARNAADFAKRPRVAKRVPTWWSASELATFLTWAADDPYGPAFHFLATTGMRRGEALGLRWDDVDLEGSRLSIHRTRIAVNHHAQEGETKTEKGTRTIELDAGTVAILRQHRARQSGKLLQAGIRAAASGFVFTHDDGQPYHPERFSREFDRRLARYNRTHPDAPLRRIRTHDLRHTWASLALQAGMHPRIVADRLGHSTTAVTLEIYSHVVPSMQSDVAERVAALIFGA